MDNKLDQILKDLVHSYVILLIQKLIGQMQESEHADLQKALFQNYVGKIYNLFQIEKERSQP